METLHVGIFAQKLGLFLEKNGETFHNYLDMRKFVQETIKSKPDHSKYIKSKCANFVSKAVPSPMVDTVNLPMSPHHTPPRLQVSYNINYQPYHLL